MTLKPRNRATKLLTLIAVTASIALLSQCEEATAPAPAGKISVTGGENQYWLKGQSLPKPFGVRVLTDDSSVPSEAVVRFRVVQGGGTLSKTSVTADKRGIAEATLTLGPDPGVNIVEASLADDPGKKVTFSAIGSYFFCPEYSDTFQVSYGTRGHLFHATPKSTFYKPDRGIVELTAVPPGANPFAPVPIDGFIEPVIRDVAFSPRGDLFISRALFFEELMKVDTDGNITRLAGLEGISEIAENPIGLIIGCDNKGPFAIQCPDTIVRFASATYADGVNNDALAVDHRRNFEDALGEDVYYIHKPDSTLRRLPLDSLTVTGPVQIVAQLTRDEADWCRGMDVDPSGNIFMVVSTNNTKKLLRFSPNGQRTELLDFMVDGSGDEMLSDLAIDNTLIYTVDTYNDNLIAYVTNTMEFIPLFADSVTQSRISDRASDGSKTGGERTGLVILR